MADNTTLYIIIGLVLLFTLMSANAQTTATGSPALSAYLKLRSSKRGANPYKKVGVRFGKSTA
jgi:hypothetical protein